MAFLSSPSVVEHVFLGSCMASWADRWTPAHLSCTDQRTRLRLVLCMKGAMATHEPSDATVLAALVATNAAGSVYVRHGCQTDSPVVVSLVLSPRPVLSQPSVNMFMACMCTAQRTYSLLVPFMMSPLLRWRVAASAQEGDHRTLTSLLRMMQLDVYVALPVACCPSTNALVERFGRLACDEGAAIFEHLACDDASYGAA